MTSLITFPYDLWWNAVEHVKECRKRRDSPVSDQHISINAYAYAITYQS